MIKSLLLDRIQQWEPVFRRLIVGGLAVLLGIVLSRLVWVIVEPGGAVSQTTDLPRYSAASSGQTKISAETSLLTSMNPFDIGAASTDIVIEDAPETGLNLLLIGSRASTVERFASATIRTPDNISNVYRPGDEIISGVTLERVLTDNQILLRRNGAVESLRKQGSGEGFLVITEDGVEPSRDQINQIIPAGPFQVADGRALFNSLIIEPIRDERGLSGYRLTSRGNVSLMREAGLQPGDVLIEFDGNGIADIEPFDIRDRLQGGSIIALTITRQGKAENVTLAIGR